MVRVIAELGMAANSVEWAHAGVDAVADAGCWAAKFQLLNADTITAETSPRYDRLAGPDTQHQAFTGALPYEAWAEVYEHARERGLEPFASCWDTQAVEVSEELLAPNWYKVGSADITHLDLLREIASTGKGVILSTGAATEAEIARAVDVLWMDTDPVILLACSLSYPCEWKDARLSRVGWLRDRFDYLEGFGYSDHTRGTAAAGLAVAAGAQYLEKHFTVTPGRGGDHDFALTPDEMRHYVLSAKHAAQAVWHPQGNATPMHSELPALMLARRSLHTTRPVRRGEQLVPGVNSAWLRPATGGIPADADGPWFAERDMAAGEQA